MKEQELEYYYPYQIDKKYSYRHAYSQIYNNKDQYDFNNEYYHDFFKRLSSNDEKLAGFFSDDFSHWTSWHQKGRNIFSFSEELLSMLVKTDVDNITFDMFHLPYDNFFLSLKPLGLFFDSEEENLIEGVYVHLERSEMESTPESERDSNMNDDYYEPEYNLLIYLNFVGNIENVIRERPDKVVFQDGEDILLNWSYKLAFPTYEDFTSVGEAIKKELEEFKAEIPKNILNNDQLSIEVFNDYKAFVDKTIRVLINSLLFLSQPKDKIDKKEEYPINLPFNFNRKFSFSKTSKEKQKIDRKINESGFSKIDFIGFSDYKRNNNTEKGLGSKSTHWRRGHWRNQPYGIGLENKRVIWIKPTLINKDNNDSDIKGHIYDVKN